MRYNTRKVDYLAFYRTKPISAVTHYGRIKETALNVNPATCFKKTPSWVRDKSLIKCYRLEWLKQLPSPIERNNHYAILRPIYSDLKTLLNSANLTELFQKRRWLSKKIKTNS
jgi:hypothetical protein